LARGYRRQRVLPKHEKSEEGVMVEVKPICLLADCDRVAVMHVRHLDNRYRGECFCCWEHLCEYAHDAALAPADLSDFAAVFHGYLRSELFLG